MCPVTRGFVICFPVVVEMKVRCLPQVSSSWPYLLSLCHPYMSSTRIFNILQLFILPNTCGYSLSSLCLHLAFSAHLWYLRLQTKFPVPTLDIMNKVLTHSLQFRTKSYTWKKNLIGHKVRKMLKKGSLFFLKTTEKSWYSVYFGYPHRFQNILTFLCAKSKCKEYLVMHLPVYLFKCHSYSLS